MGKSDKLEIHFSEPMGVYFAGDTLKGTVTVEIRKDLKIRGVRLKLSGKANVHWKDSKGRSGRMVYFRSEENYFEEDFELFGQGKLVDVILPKGNHTFPFQLDLPSTLPSSFEGSFGYVRYVAMATVDLPLMIDYVTNSAFTVLNQLELNNEPANLRLPVSGVDETTVSCLCLASGSVSAEFSINKRAFVPGESIIISGHVTNNTNVKVDLSKASLQQHVEYFGIPDAMFSSKEMKSTETTDTINSVDRGTIEPGGTQNWSGVTLEIPSIPPSKLSGCEIINIFYTVELQVTCKYGGSIHLSTDIVVGTIPFSEDPSPPAETPSSYPSVNGAGGDERTAVMDEGKDSGKAGVVKSGDPGGENGVIKQQNTTSNSCTAGPKAPVKPSLVESANGRVFIKDKSESKNMKGKLSWAPVYQMYKFANIMQESAAATAATAAATANAGAKNNATAADSDTVITNAAAAESNTTTAAGSESTASVTATAAS